MSKEKVWLNTRSIPKEKNKRIEVMGSDDEDIGFFVNESGWVVTPVAWREI